MRNRPERSAAQEAIAAYAIAGARPAGSVATLSGGNQQKVLISRWVRVCKRVLILDEPTRGVDVGAKFEIYRVIRELASTGTAIILVSSELPEALAMSDRLVVMREKRVVHEFSAHGHTQEEVMSYATGATKA
jgi:ribose transport system ATP-binding protein